jgi:hypothetical protein
MDLQQLLDALNEQTRKVNELRALNQQAQAVICKWIDANAAATSLINEQADEIKRLREKEFDLHVSIERLRIVIAHAHSETSIDGVAQNISSDLFAEMHAVLEDAGWG